MWGWLFTGFTLSIVWDGFRGQKLLWPHNVVYGHVVFLDQCWRAICLLYPTVLFDVVMHQLFAGLLVLGNTRACERSGKRSGAGRKSGERERTFQKTIEGSGSARSWRPRSGRRAKSTAESPLTPNIKDWSLLTFRWFSDILHIFVS